jgi:nitroreductase/NAD-dependent dihydropyrimidine dehydrogenase PreA subunit
MPVVTIDSERCLKDGLCARICRKVFSQAMKGSVPIIAHEESCDACGHCVLVCPGGAIRHAEYPQESVHQVSHDPMPSYEQMRQMIVTRRSIRTFQKRPVEKEIVEKLIDGARFAPSAKNTQSTKFIAVQDESLLHEIASITAAWLGMAAQRLKNRLWRKLYILLGERDVEKMARSIGQFELIAEQMRKNVDLILFEAPALLLFHANKRVRFAEVNANLALHNAMMLASSLGLGTLYTGYVVTACGHDKTIPRLLGLAKNEKVYGGLAIGYPEIEFSKWVDRHPARVRWM